METKCSIKGKLIKGICSIDFSPSGKYLAAACIDDNHHVAVYDVSGDGALVGIEKSGGSVILSCVFINDNSFVTAGIKTFYLWSVGAKLKKKAG